METKQEKIRKLKEFDRKEIEVIWYLSQDKKDEEIARILNVSIKTIQTRKTEIYRKLEIKVPDSEKKDYLYNEYGPLVLEQIPTESALKNYKTPFRERNGEEPEKNEKQGNNSRTPNWFLIAIVLLLAFVAVGYFAYRFGRQSTPVLISSPSAMPMNTVASPLPLIPSPTLPQSATILLTDTLVPTSTDTPEPTLTAVPTNTALPHILLPFTDNFANGVNPPWQVTSGKWIVDSTGATITIADINDPAGSIALDDPTMTNYTLRVHVHSPHVLSANQGDFGVVVRYRSDHDQNLVFYMNSASRWGWGYLPSLMDLPFNPEPITSVQKANITSDATIEIDATGNKFTAKVDGETYDSFTMSGYETGGIALITKCGNVGSCPSFSNLSLTPLP